MPKCLVCNKIIPSEIKKERLVSVFKTFADGSCSQLEGIHFYQCWKHRYKRDGVWTKSREELTRVLGQFLIESKKSPFYSKDSKHRIETECMRIQRITNSKHMRNAIYNLLDTVELY